MTSLHQFTQAVGERDGSALTDFKNQVFKFNRHSVAFSFEPEKQAGGDRVHLAPHLGDFVLDCLFDFRELFVGDDERCGFEHEGDSVVSNFDVEQVHQLHFKFRAHSNSFGAGVRGKESR